MVKLELTEFEASSLRRAIHYAIDARLKGLASARRRVRAALDLGEKPDEHDAGTLDFCENELANLRRIKAMIDAERGDVS